jgi:hypothetical protein
VRARATAALRPQLNGGPAPAGRQRHMLRDGDVISQGGVVLHVRRRVER